MTRDLRELFEIILQGMIRDLNGSQFGFKALATAASQQWSKEKGGLRAQHVAWQHEQTLGVGDGQGILACCIPWSHKESDMT